MEEVEFERRLWAELSSVVATQKDHSPWDPSFSSDPNDKKFCFSFAGSAFFVVGLHPLSSRKARQFPYPTLVFNLYDQFKALMMEGNYERMTNVNRKRELQYQGGLNPMVVTYGNEWESIQFSGANNPPHWKCPYKR